ncbi:MAG: hypothetical protein ACR2FO_00540 [Actinomycetota bacterium]
MSPRYFESELQTSTARPETLINRRIVLVAAVLMAELWALTAAIEAWSEGHASVLGWILGFQVVLFLLALSIATATPPQPAVQSNLAPIMPRQPVTAE